MEKKIITAFNGIDPVQLNGARYDKNTIQISREMADPVLSHVPIFKIWILSRPVPFLWVNTWFRGQNSKNRVGILYWFYYRIPYVTEQDQIPPIETGSDKTGFNRISRLVPSRSLHGNPVVSRSKILRQRQILSCPVPIFELHNSVLSCPVDSVKNPGNYICRCNREELPDIWKTGKFPLCTRVGLFLCDVFRGGRIKLIAISLSRLPANALFSIWL